MKASLVVDYHLDNQIFNIVDKSINRDNCTYSVWLLKWKFQAINIEISTCDINKPSESQFALCFDLPNYDVIIESRVSYLVLFESEVIKPKNWDKVNHQIFEKIFTWHDELVDNKKYFKINFCHKFPEDQLSYRENQVSFDEKKLCTLISGNKKVNHSLELYSERVKIIKWFENNALNDFDLYGVGWDKYISKNKYVRFLLSKVHFLNKLIIPSFPSYKGAVESKLETLKKYKFSICFENAQMIPGYITEKIFDCFFAGCVPIYWGAPNITDHIPENCFIDYRKFSSYEDLYAYMCDMPEEAYQEILQNIENFLFSESADPYRAESFANIIVRHICNDIAESL